MRHSFIQCLWCADFETLCVTESIAEAESFMRSYLPRIYGDVDAVFEEVTTHQGNGVGQEGFRIEAVDMEGGLFALVD